MISIEVRIEHESDTLGTGAQFALSHKGSCHKERISCVLLSSSARSSSSKHTGDLPFVLRFCPYHDFCIFLSLSTHLHQMQFRLSSNCVSCFCQTNRLPPLFLWQGQSYRSLQGGRQWGHCNSGIWPTPYILTAMFLR